MIRLVISILFLALTFSMSAASATKDAPEPPYLATLKPNTQWTITVEPRIKKPEPKSPEEIKASEELERWVPHLESIIGYKGDKDRVMVSIWRGGKKTETYVIDGITYKVATPRYPDDIHALDPTRQYSDAPDYAKSDFPNLNWVGPATFVRTTTEANRHCYLYQLTGTPSISGTISATTTEAAPAEPAPSQQVWIDATTRLPFKHDDGKYLMTYAFSEGGFKPIVPPPAFQKLIDEVRRQKAAGH